MSQGLSLSLETSFLMDILHTSWEVVVSYVLTEVTIPNG